MSARPNRVTTRTLAAMRLENQPISMLTAYDYPTARLLDAAGVDVLLVGDSLAMVVQGHSTTLPVTLDQMIYHAEMVARAAERAMVLVDLPFPEGQLSIERTVEAAARVLKETRATAVKLEGGAEQAQRIEALAAAGIPVMAHVGLRPQNVHVDGGYRVQRDAQKLITDARVAEASGAFAVLIECVPAKVGEEITRAIEIPTIGIGAGPDTSGQVLVFHDLVGLSEGYLPRFVKPYAATGATITEAAKNYCEDVRSRRYPGPEHTFK
ncbi:3-methyl-2-oxobutanoate hydroxymethyltransferase [Candidatus Laterigemmans baculatus]|uniref:3-methyl-2-oxobutanoate hydroxymethyltransferase n=1 Tax=Candidatus Laterigemmans baculatus TaxID=2770505 RepID=UPI0013D96993|nr:3-methyl-2-oxobutanoate hydroxymethyltransferase [Candidatus Laterigemmans baculatus]